MDACIPEYEVHPKPSNMVEGIKTQPPISTTCVILHQQWTSLGLCFYSVKWRQQHRLCRVISGKCQLPVQGRSLCPLASLVAQRVNRLPAVPETWVWSLGREDPLEKEMATYPSTLAWKIPRTVEPGRLQSMGSQRVTHDWETSLYVHTHVSTCIWVMCMCTWVFESQLLLSLLSQGEFWKVNQERKERNIFSSPRKINYTSNMNCSWE